LSEEAKPIACNSQAAAKQGLGLVTDLHSWIQVGKFVIAKRSSKVLAVDKKALKSQQL